MIGRDGGVFTPTTEDIREAYYESPGVRDWEAARAAAFDRWLEQHDAEVLAAAKSAAKQRHEATRCGAEGRAYSAGHPAPRCTRKAGHDGNHSRNGRHYWGPK